MKCDHLHCLFGQFILKTNERIGMTCFVLDDIYSPMSRTPFNYTTSFAFLQALPLLNLCIH